MSQIVTIDFHDETIFAVERDDGVYIAVTPICVSLGLNPSMQRQRIMRDAILSEGGIMVILPSAGGPQETFCLRLDLVHGWLFTIDESRVKDEPTRQKVLLYKRQCYRVLSDYFNGPRLRAGWDLPADVIPMPAAGVFPDWPLEEMRTKRGLVDCYRMTWGPLAAQWAMVKLGFPVPPPELVSRPRQLEIFEPVEREALDG